MQLVDRWRSSTALFLVAACVTALSLRAYAAPEPAALQEVSGAVTVAGDVEINGNAAATGATLLSGSKIVTGSNGSATIDLGPLGRVLLGPKTTATLTFAPGSVNVRTTGETRVEVIRGEAEIRTPTPRMLAAGQNATFGGDSEIQTSGGADIQINVDTRQARMAGYIGPGWTGFAILIGLAAAIAGGIQLGDEGNQSGTPLPPVSPTVP